MNILGGSVMVTRHSLEVEILVRFQAPQHLWAPFRG